MLFLILSLIIQVGLIVHIVKTGRGMMWVFIVLFFPLVGALAYFIVEILPELPKTPVGKVHKGLLRKMFDRRQ